MGYVKLPLVSEGGVKAMVSFDQGNPMTRECPTASISDPFWQMVMEETYVKRGMVSLLQSIPEESDKKEEPTTTKSKKYNEVPEVDTLEKAIDYMANEFAIQVTSISAAIRESRKLGVDFPNLKKQ